MTNYFLKIRSILVVLIFISGCKKDEPTSQTAMDPVVNTGLVSNGDFRSGLSAWGVKKLGAATVTEVKDGENSCLKLYHPTANAWCAIGQEIRTKLSIGKVYEVSFRYKVIDGAAVKLGISWGDASLWSTRVPIKEWGTELTLDGQWHTIVQRFTASSTFPAAGVPMLGIYFDYNFSLGAANVLIDDYTMTE